MHCSGERTKTGFEGKVDFITTGSFDSWQGTVKRTFRLVCLRLHFATSSFQRKAGQSGGRGEERARGWPVAGWVQRRPVAWSQWRVAGVGEP